jgi:hypothetical protein
LLISKFLSPLDDLSTSIRWFDRRDLDHPIYQLGLYFSSAKELLCSLIRGELERRKGIPFGQFYEFERDICLLSILLISSCLENQKNKADLDTR